MAEDKRKHLEFIQAIIARMANNSFLIKGWSLTLTAAILVFSAEASRPTIALVALLPLVLFWGLDAYYLRQERLYRKLYDAARLEGTGLPSPDLFSLSPASFGNEVDNWVRTLIAPTVVGFHSVVTVLVVLVVVLILLLQQRGG